MTLPFSLLDLILRIPLSTRNLRSVLPQPPGLALPLQQAQDVALPYGTLDISHDGTASPGASVGVHELDADLGHITGVTGASQDSVDFGELDWLILGRKSYTWQRVLDFR